MMSLILGENEKFRELMKKIPEKLIYQKKYYKLIIFALNKLEKLYLFLTCRKRDE